MTLTTHVVAGALVGAVASQNLAFAAFAAFMSHLLLDSIPHWDYTLTTSKEDKKNRLNNDMTVGVKDFYIDLLKISFDFGLGMVIAALAFKSLSPEIFTGAMVGALFGVLPDPLQFVYWKLRPRILEPLQRFHLYIHARTRLNNRPVFGILSQVAIIIIILILTRALFV